MNGRLREQVAATVQLAGPTPWVGLRRNEEGEVANLPFPALCSALERSFKSWRDVGHVVLAFRPAGVGPT